MLVLQRRVNESLIISFGGPDGRGRKVRIKINSIGNRNVRLGIDAERDVRVWRAEVPQERRRSS